ncbi:MULE domain-containing protein [Heracleum sosnowskyi]|uniref:MULE domain-containing protein n=1 Tax=Heracleum sosnowskyi TaxID=360622 RepID=A0AAD8IM31_9APIA|nr:MULE domain-containing protein [Heracleum sosnowskyi]
MRAFINGCRNVVGLDGCHLKGKYGGCLLSATALDGQNGLVPLGIMVCKNECVENWFLFLKHLKPRLDEHHVQEINFISDRQKGLRDAVHTLFPTSPHRFRFRHMYQNFKSHFKGSKLHTMVELVLLDYCFLQYQRFETILNLVSHVVSWFDGKASHQKHLLRP